MPAFGDLAYPFRSGTFEGSCACKFFYFPQIHATFDAIGITKEKVGFDEYGDTPSDPPKKYLKRFKTWRYLIVNANFNPFASEGGFQFWEQEIYDPDTGESTITKSDPAIEDVFIVVPSGSADEETETELTRTVTVRSWGSDSDLVAREEIAETISEEMTTEQLVELAIAELPEWPDDFPPEEPYSDPPAETAPAGSCYDRGQAVWGAFRLSIPNVWSLPDDELSITIRRVKYRVDFPMPKLPGDYTFAWQEVFIPDDAESEDDWKVLANVASSGVSDSDAASDPLELTETRENGQVFVRNARVSAIA